MRLNIGGQVRNDKETKEMAAKPAEITTGSDLASMEKETENLGAELGAIEKMLASGDGSVAELESSIIRQQAINLRLKALSAKMEAERARLAEIKRKEDEHAAREFDRQADEYMKDIVAPLVDAHRIARLSSKCASKASSLKGYGSSVGPGYRTVRALTYLIAAVAPDRYYGTDFGNRLVDRENPDADA